MRLFQVVEPECYLTNENSALRKSDEFSLSSLLIGQMARREVRSFADILRRPHLHVGPSLRCEKFAARASERHADVKNARADWPVLLLLLRDLDLGRSRFV